MDESQDDPITDNIELSTALNDFPEGHAQLVLREGDVTHIIQGPSEDVEQRLWLEVADDLSLSVDELADADNYPMPEVREGLVPAEEFHDSSGV